MYCYHCDNSECKIIFCNVCFIALDDACRRLLRIESNLGKLMPCINKTCDNKVLLKKSFQCKICEKRNVDIYDPKTKLSETYLKICEECLPFEINKKCEEKG